MGKQCPNCGKELKDNANFCGECGTIVSPVSEEKEIGEQIKKVNDKNIQKCILETEKYTPKNWWKRTGGIIFGLIVFFPIGLYLMWKYANWKRSRKVIVTLIWGIVFFCWSLGSYPDMPDESEELIIENSHAKFGAVYNYDLEETKDKVDKVLSDFYNSDMSLDEFTLTPYEYGNSHISYTYTSSTPQGYKIGIELGFWENKLEVVIVKTESPLTSINSDGLGDIQEIYSMIIGSITNDELEVEEIKDVVKTGNVKTNYYRNGNVYGICRTPEDSPMVFYYMVVACTDERAEETGCQKL